MPGVIMFNIKESLLSSVNQILLKVESLEKSPKNLNARAFSAD